MNFEHLLFLFLAAALCESRKLQRNSAEILMFKGWTMLHLDASGQKGNILLIGNLSLVAI